MMLMEWMTAKVNGLVWNDLIPGRSHFVYLVHLHLRMALSL